MHQVSDSVARYDTYEHEWRLKEKYAVCLVSKMF